MPSSKSVPHTGGDAKPSRGGVRPGAGRKPKPDAKKAINARVAVDVADLIQGQSEGQRGAYIEAAVRYYESRERG